MIKKIAGLNDNLKTVILTALIIILNVAAVLIFGLTRADIESEYISPAAFILSTVLFVSHIPFCIILRVCRITTVSKAIFFYQLIGVISYVVFFAGYIAGQGQPNGLTAFYVVFNWWTIGYQNFMVMISRFTGIPFKFTGAILYMLITYFTASMYAATKKDIRYEENRRKEQEYIESTKAQHRQ